MKATRTPLQDLSKRAFNSEHRLSICGGILTLNGLFTCDELADLVPGSERSCYKELDRLVDLGVLQRVPAGRTVTYQVLPGSFWDWVGELLRRVPTPATPSDAAGQEP